MDNMFGKLEDLRELLEVDSNTALFYEQIMNEDEDYTSPKIDHFTELYQSFSEIFEDDTIPQDDLATVTDQFTQICCHIINYINEKFDTDIEVESLMDSSLFTNYSQYGMLLLRNRFFKSCCFPVLRRLCTSSLLWNSMLIFFLL